MSIIQKITAGFSGLATDVRNMLTEANNDILDMKRVVLGGGALTYFSLSAWPVIARHADFNMEGFGLGLAAILGGGGGMLWAGRKAENAPGMQRDGTVSPPAAGDVPPAPLG